MVSMVIVAWQGIAMYGLSGFADVRANWMQENPVPILGSAQVGPKRSVKYTCRLKNRDAKILGGEEMSRMKCK